MDIWIHCYWVTRTSRQEASDGAVAQAIIDLVKRERKEETRHKLYPLKPHFE